MTGLEMMAACWGELRGNDLYDIGYHDVVEWSGAHIAGDEKTTLRACAYMMGAAGMARLVCEPHTPKWWIARIVERMAGTFVSLLSTDIPIPAEMIDKLWHTYRAELVAEMEKL